MNNQSKPPAKPCSFTTQLFTRIIIVRTLLLHLYGMDSFTCKPCKTALSISLL